MEKQEHYPFTLMPLPYEYNALEPFIDEKTIRLHHDRHLQAYINNLNGALKDYPDLHSWSLEQLLYYNESISESIRTAIINNGGGVYNHNFYFKNLINHNNQADISAGNLIKAVNKTYGNFDEFKKEFKNHALSVFGSGYTWLVADKFGELQIINTKNQDSVISAGLCPVILTDVWEHAYYLKNYNVRSDYIDNWFNVLNTARAEENYNKRLMI